MEQEETHNDIDTTVKTQQEEPQKHSHTKIYGIFAVAVIVLLTMGILVMNPLSKDNPESTQTTTVSANESNVTPTSFVSDKEYKDGVYTVTGHYESPGGEEEVGVSLTLEDNVITEASVEVMAERPISVEKQTDFAANFQEFVVGRPISEVMLTKVSGASLTPKGFNDAVEQIKQQASS